MTPRAGAIAGGTTITISGTSFASLATVLVGGVAATNVVVVSATQITARTAAHAAATVDVQVATAAGRSAASKADWFAYGAPVVTALSVLQLQLRPRR